MQETILASINHYQRLASRTLIDRPGFEIAGSDMMLIWNAIGLAGETGEVCDLIKKGIFHQHGLDKEKLFDELGDVMWYLAALCTKLGFDLSDVMQHNIDKLIERYPDGYSAEDSINRKEYEPS